MTRQEFIKQIDEHYASNGDFELFNCGDEEEIIIPSVDVKITFNENDTFNIYRNFCYPLDDYNEDFHNELLGIIEESTKKELEKVFGKVPNVEFDYGMGCPFDDVLVGYFNISYDLNYVVRFITACEDAENINDISYYEQIIRIIEPYLKSIGFSQYEGSSFISDDKLTLLFVGEPNNVKFPKLKIKSENFVSVDIYDGIKYTFGKSQSGQIIAVQPRFIKQYNEICSKYNLTDSPEYYSDQNRFLYIKGKISYLICLLRYQESMVDEEKKILVDKLSTLKTINPNIILSNLDFSTLNESEFENLCYEVLVKRGFVDVHPVGKTNAPDGGKDLIATEYIDTLTGQETRKWIWQCKHSKKSLDRKDVSEIEDLLNENNAQGYGLFCSNSISPSAVDRLERKKQLLGSNKLVYYGCRELETLLGTDINLISKYKLWGIVK